MLYNILFEFIFGKSDLPNMFKHISDITNIKYSGEVDNINSNADVYLFNHVSWTDFFMDNYIIHGNGCYFSRVSVFFAVPFTSIYGLLNNMIFFFNRSHKNVKDTIKMGFKTVIDKNKKKVIFYPEGTRNKTKNIIPLKRGGLNMIYNLGYSLQIINVKNKDKVFDEEKFQLNENVVCDIVTSDVINPTEYNNFDEFYADVCEKWEECFYKTSGSNGVAEIINKEIIQSLSRVYLVGSFVFLSLLSYFNLNLFIGVVHLFYFGMIIVSKHISTLKKLHIQSFIFYYNWFQVLLSAIMSIYGYGIIIFNKDNPLLLNDFDENIYIKNFILLHAFSKVVDFIDTAILIVSGKKLSFLHTYHHLSIGLIWFYLYNENINSAYFGAMVNSIVHTVMYIYYNYSDKLKYIKSWITKMQLTQFIILIIHPIFFICTTENEWYKKLAFFQILYQLSMVILFGNFYYKNYNSSINTKKI
jgi:1-acyl-sn-glycerol-3-phosphate acyltransferase